MTQNDSKKFRPERPIYLNKENTGLKTEVEIELKVEELRSRGWLCVSSHEKKSCSSSHEF